jgi:methanogenic corrinoid protein MtbC1
MTESSIPLITVTNDIGAHLSSYLDCVERGDRRAAIELAVGLVERGADAERVITDLLAAAQREVGQQWLEGRWSIAVEHRASAITESALQAVSETAMRAPGAIEEGSKGRVVIACGEGEWHVLPGRMASEVLRLRGADVSYIGPSVPARDLAEMLGDDPPTAVAITCSMSMSLTGAWATITALRSIGMTIICAGRGFGPAGAWGLAVGADRWAPDFTSGAELILDAVNATPAPPRPPAGRPDLMDETRILGRDHESLVEAANTRALASWPSLRDRDPALRATRDDLSATLRTIASANLVGDSTIITDYVDWFETALAARDIPPAFVPTAFASILHAVPDNLANTRSMATLGLAACG